MTSSQLSLFLEFNDAVPNLSRIYFTSNDPWAKVFLAQIQRLDPVAAEALGRKMLDDIVVDERLLHLYDEINDFQTQAVGSGYRFDVHHPLVEKTIALLKDTTGAVQPTSEDMAAFIQLVKGELEKDGRIAYLTRFLNQHSETVNRFRMQKIEESVNAVREASSSQTASASKSVMEFTQVQQAIALRYLFNEVLGLTNVDTTRIIALGHLLAAKAIPRDEQTGAWKIANSGLKSAFTKAVRKSGLSYLADLRFVLRVFEPLRGQGATAIDSAIATLERDISREEKKLAKEKD